MREKGKGRKKKRGHRSRLKSVLFLFSPRRSLPRTKKKEKGSGQPVGALTALAKEDRKKKKREKENELLSLLLNLVIGGKKKKGREKRKGEKTSGRTEGGIFLNPNPSRGKKGGEKKTRDLKGRGFFHEKGRTLAGSPCCNWGEGGKGGRKKKVHHIENPPPPHPLFLGPIFSEKKKRGKKMDAPMVLSPSAPVREKEKGRGKGRKKRKRALFFFPHLRRHPWGRGKGGRERARFCMPCSAKDRTISPSIQLTSGRAEGKREKRGGPGGLSRRVASEPAKYEVLPARRVGKGKGKKKKGREKD